MNKDSQMSTLEYNQQNDEILGAIAEKPYLVQNRELMNSIGVSLKNCKKCYNRRYIGSTTVKFKNKYGKVEDKKIHILCKCVVDAVLHRKQIDIHKEEKEKKDEVQNN